MTQDFHKLYPNARYFGSEWVKDDNAAPQTKPCLYPEDPMFKTFFQTFVKVWIEEYGPVHNFVASPPCESHISTTIDDYINISVTIPSTPMKLCMSWCPKPVFSLTDGACAPTPRPAFGRCPA